MCRIKQSIMWIVLGVVLILAMWATPVWVAAEPARCNNLASPSGPGAANVNCGVAALGQPLGFQAPHNPTAEKCGVIGGAALAAKGCWEKPFYPGGPTPAPWTTNPLRSSWLDACLVKDSIQSPFTKASDQHTKIACCNSSTCVKLGAPPFDEPGSSDPAQCPASHRNAFACPYTAVSNVLLKDKPGEGEEEKPRTRFLHWTGIDGTEDETPFTGFLAEAKEIDSPWRLLDLTGAAPGQPGTLSIPRHLDLISGTTVDDDTGGGGDRFCANQTVLPSGRPVVAGGTRWTDDHCFTPSDPSTSSSQACNVSFLALDLEGLRSTTVYDTDTNLTLTAGPMGDGRWYMSMVPLGSGNVLGGAGITTLRLASTHRDTWEVFDHKTHRWIKFPRTDISPPCSSTAPHGTGNVGTSPCRLLPLFSRLQLLPNGEVFYPAVGQLWGPFGIPRVAGTTWHKTFITNPEPATGIPNPGTWRETGDASPATRNGAQVLMRPLVPPYNTATVVTMGGIPYPPATDFGACSNPAGAPFCQPHDLVDPYVPPTIVDPVNTVEVVAVSAPSGSSATVMSRVSGTPMQEGRWFATAVLLPDRSAMNIGGGTKDEVVNPGSEHPIFMTERSRDGGLTDPWKLTATAHRPRTYHNTAGLVTPDGRVASSGHRPISKSYVGNTPIEDSDQHSDPATTYQFGRDLMWEVYEPGYLFKGNGTPSVRPALKEIHEEGKFTYGRTVCLQVTPVNGILNVSAQLQRPQAVTHVDQHEQRLVVLETLGTCDGGNGILVRMPPNGHVAPPGFWMLSVLEFSANPTNPDWPDVPSEAQFIQLCRKQNTGETFGVNCTGP